ncbi:hypothetical protein B0X71_08930 [Planococcus lenghuensis]|uniref:DUF4352 domain-containing protein n=1 Tax=Planococcus lenghuensis TaxID=2213202 RepID=A0A1Q2L3R8_9BACL|nr:hypothetical protein B0X71_08930 [Planococcus lenghuensis]
MLIAGGCSIASDQAESTEETANEQTSEIKDAANQAAQKQVLNHVAAKTYVNNPQAPETRSLKEVGQTFTDEDGSVTLKAITDYSGTHSIGPVKLTIADIKVMNYSPSPDLIDYFHGYTHSEDNFSYIKLQVTIENTSEQLVDFAPVSVLETNEGEKKDFEDDFYLQNLYGQLQSGETKMGELAFVLEKTDLENLKSIAIHTSDVFDEKKTSLHEGEIVEISF